MMTVNDIERLFRDNYGAMYDSAVQLRINGAEVSNEEVIALNPDDIIRSSD